VSSTKRRPKRCRFIAGGDRCERDAVADGPCHGHDAQVRRHLDQELVPLHASQGPKTTSWRTLKSQLKQIEKEGEQHVAY